MAEMIVVKCDIGSKAATVLCPNCARISRQILKTPFNNRSNNELISPHTCPVCGASYRVCNSFGADVWTSAFQRYSMAPDAYNAEVKANNERKNERAENRNGAEMKSAPVQTPKRQVEENRPKADQRSVQDDMANTTDAGSSVNTQPQKTTENRTTSEIPMERPDQAREATPNPLLERKLDRWKKELLDTGKRNKMINYRETSRTTLKILEPSPAELFNLLAVSEKELTFQRPISKESDFRTYSILSLLETLSYKLPVYVGDIKAEGTVLEREKTLKNLRNKTKLAQEEQGTNILYLSFGFIQWREHNRESSAWIKSPLLMMPVQLGLKSLNAPFTLSKHDEEIEVNPTLDYLFNQDYGIDLPTFELKNKDSFENYLEQIEEIIDKKGWKLIREVSLGLLSFLKISMYHDLDENRNQIMNNPVIQAISGDRNALGTLPDEVINFDFDSTQPTEWHEVVDSDSSQEEAIMLSKNGISFVMQGPPGTGKSQTITNIIAEALGDGKKILFVSEKSAALQVVLKRLTEAKLDDFCLSLHNYKANKKEIIDNIGANLSLGDCYVDSSTLSELTELFHDRQYLNEYAHELHKPIEPLGESIYSAFGKCAALEDATHIEFSLDNPTQVSKEQYMSYLYVIDAFEKALHSMGGKLSDNPWAYTLANSSGQAFKTEMINYTDGLSERLRDMKSATNEMMSTYGISLGESWNDVSDAVTGLKEILSLPVFPITWKDANYRRELKERALLEEQIDQNERGHARRLAGLGKQILDLWDTDGLDCSADSIGEAFSDTRIWNEKADNVSVTEMSDNVVHSLQSAVNEIEYILSAYRRASELLRISDVDSVSSIEMLADLLSVLKDSPEMEGLWFDVRRSNELYKQINEAKKHRDNIESIKESVLSEWEPDVLKIDSKGMLARFKTEYTGTFYKFKGSYKEDIKQLRLLSKKIGGTLNEKDAIGLLQQLDEINNEKQWFIDNENRLKIAFAGHYDGPDTDLVKISNGIKAASDIANMFPYANIPPETVSAILEIGNNIQLIAKVRELVDQMDSQRVSRCTEYIRASGAIDKEYSDVSIAEVVVPVFKERLTIEEGCQTVAARLDNAKKDGKATLGDVKKLISFGKAIHTECLWFKDNIPEISNELKLDELTADATIKQEVTKAALVLRNHDAIAVREERDALTGLFGDRYTGNDTDWQGVIQDIDAVEALESHRLSENMSNWIETLCDDMEKRAGTQDCLDSIERCMSEMKESFTYFDDLFPAVGLRTVSIEVVAEKYDTCMNDFGELNKWLDYAETKAECDKCGLKSFTDEIEQKDNTVDDVKRAFERGFYNQWLRKTIDDVPSVQVFRRRVHEQRLGKFRSIDKKQFESSIYRIRESVINTFPDRNAVTSAHSELRILQHEMEKKRRIMPLRRLFQEIPELLLTLKPCLMMSPLSVAHFLDANKYHFDMVIFDEASQIFPQDAIGAIFRADQTIIAGDTRQLPPTNFFTSSTSNNDDEFDDENEDEFEDEMYDSILEETANILPNRTLLWHYRSRHEQLIAFSNHEIYRDELVTFPSSNESEPDTGVEFEYVEEGYYEGGGRNNNVPEAKRCVELVKRHIDKYPERSLGIIAFSEKQQQTIALEVQRFREQNPEYEGFFEEGKEEEFFVKNLENVQGDERDTIIFSVCYAKTKEQKANDKPMSMRFGPLGISGGERRLNVAVTRARTNIKLVSSILPSDINLDKTESEGIRMLRSYIEFAMNGNAALAISRNERQRDEFAAAVAKFLVDKEYKVRQNVGCSDYKIDIAIEHPEIQNEFVAGIECDGLSYASARTARDRDRLRGSVLESMGWNLYRVWSAEWYKNHEIEENRLTEFVEKAIKSSTDRLRKIKEEREAEEKKRREEAERIKAKKEKEERKRLLEEELKSEAKRETNRGQEKSSNIDKDRSHLRVRREEKANNPAQPSESTSNGDSNNSKTDYAWVKTGAMVQHDSFGMGKIKKIEELYVTVVFNDGVTRKFGMPNAFTKGFLKKVTNSKEIPIDRNRVSANRQMTIGDLMNSGGTDSKLLEDLRTNGFSSIDNRASSSIIWVVFDAEKKDIFENIVSRHRVQYKLEKRGAMATGGRAAWRIML